MGLLDEVAQQGFGDLEVGDHAVLQWSYGDNRTWRAPQHLLGFGADRQYALGAARVLVHRDHRGLVAHDTFALGVNQRVRGAQIDRKILREPTEH